MQDGASPGPKGPETAGRPSPMNRSQHELLWCYIDMLGHARRDKRSSSVFISNSSSFVRTRAESQ
jgi:hypothetical protein